MPRKKLSDMTPVERIDRALSGLSWEEAEEAGIEILARCMAFHCYVRNDGEEYYKRIMKCIAERGDKWAKENSAYLYFASVGDKMRKNGNN